MLGTSPTGLRSGPPQAHDCSSFPAGPLTKILLTLLLGQCLIKPLTYTIRNKTEAVTSGPLPVSEDFFRKAIGDHDNEEEGMWQKSPKLSHVGNNETSLVLTCPPSGKPCPAVAITTIYFILVLPVC